MHRWSRPFIAVGVFICWAAITALSSRLWRPEHSHTALNETVSGSVQPSFAIAIAFLFAAIGLLRWGGIGLTLPRPLSTIRLAWFPALYILGFAGIGLAIGLPPASTLAIVAANTFMVGISEELACRGILYRGLRDRFSILSAIIISTVLFGSMHLLNGFTTGYFGAAAIQSITAFMSGIAFMALRIRTGSLLPGIAVHGAWDFALVAMASGAAVKSEGAASAGAMSLWLPLMLILPNFLYGCYLLRRVGRSDHAEDGWQATA